jgi:diketogulonate reductase-like aldo/keto reductase
MHPAVQTRPVPSSGEPIPVIALGTWRTFDVAGKGAREELARCVATFHALGGRLIDSSPMYGRAEEVVGDIVARLGLRDEVLLATKVWTSGRARGVDQMRDSMRKLRVDRVDLMQVHNLVDTAVHLETLRRWKSEGLVRYIGVTHYTASAHAEVARVLRSESIDFVQINYSVAEPEAERTIFPLAADRGVAVIVNRPFATGAALGPLRRAPVPAWAAEIGCTTWPQLLLKFVVSHPAVTCAIPATGNEAHLRENMAAGVGPIPDERMRERIAREAFGVAR